jgi:hypothetical protein
MVELLNVCAGALAGVVASVVVAAVWLLALDWLDFGER